MGAPFRKKSDKKNRNSKNQNEVPICEPKTANEKWEFGSNKNLGREGTKNELRKPIRKKIRSNKSKNSKHQSEIAAREQNH